MITVRGVAFCHPVIIRETRSAVEANRVLSAALIAATSEVTPGRVATSAADIDSTPDMIGPARRLRRSPFLLAVSGLRNAPTYSVLIAGRWRSIPCRRLPAPQVLAEPDPSLQLVGRASFWNHRPTPELKDADRPLTPGPISLSKRDTSLTKPRTPQPGLRLSKQSSPARAPCHWLFPKHERGTDSVRGTRESSLLAMRLARS